MLSLHDSMRYFRDPIGPHEIQILCIYNSIILLQEFVRKNKDVFMVQF